MSDDFDEFESATEASSYPTMEQLQGRLVLVKPLKLTKDVPSTTYKDAQGRPTLSDRYDVDIKVVDGPLADFDTTEFESMWLSQSYMVSQLHRFFKNGKTLLGTVQLKDPRKSKGQGNPWGFEPATAEDVQAAKNYLAGIKMQSVGGAEAAEDNPFKK